MVRPTQSSRRQFNSSSIQQNRKPRFPSVKAPESKTSQHPLSYLNQRAEQFFSEDGSLPQNYSPEQRAAIEAAKKFDTLKHLKTYRGGMRTGPYKLNYFDDLTKIDPVIDKAVRQPMTNIDDNQRLKTEDDFAEDFIEQAMKEYPMETHRDEDGNEYLDSVIPDNEWENFDRNIRLTKGRIEAELQAPSALAPDLPMLNPPKKKQASGKGRRRDDAEEEEQQQNRSQETLSPALITLMQMTGYSKKEIAQIRVKALVRHGVSNQTRLGKIHRSYVLSVAGNGNGMVGIGEGKSSEASDALMQSQYRAIRSMQPILRYEDRTIFGEVKAKVSATELELYPRAPGMS